MCTFNTDTPQHIRKTDRNGRRSVGVYLLRLEMSPIYQKQADEGQKISKDVTELNNTINQLDIIDTYKLLHEHLQNTSSLQAHMNPDQDRPYNEA